MQERHHKASCHRYAKTSKFRFRRSSSTDLSRISLIDMDGILIQNVQDCSRSVLPVFAGISGAFTTGFASPAAHFCAVFLNRLKSFGEEGIVHGQIAPFSSLADDHDQDVRQSKRSLLPRRISCRPSVNRGKRSKLAKLTLSQKRFK